LVGFKKKKKKKKGLLPIKLNRFLVDFMVASAAVKAFGG
jgi:hypothetical protein